MRTLREIKTRIRTISKIEQMTTAMHQISRARHARALSRAAAFAPYARGLQRVQGFLVAGSQMPASGPPRTPDCLIVLTSEKGLCGSFNHDMLREAQKSMAAAPVQPSLVVVGDRGRSLLRRDRVPIAFFFPQPSLSGLDAWAAETARWLMTRWRENAWRWVEMVHGRHRSEGAAVPARTTLLPVPVPCAPADGIHLFEPAADAQAESLLPAYMEAMLQHAMVETICAEQMSRMHAMAEAARNARDMLATLRRQYNRARQALITTQIIETSEAAAHALEAATD